MNKRLGITIIGFKNAAGIKRLLSSLDRIKIEDNDITLIFSIDYSGDHTVEQIANDYTWKYGQKIVLAHEHNLGLRAHILMCGDYIEEYGFDAMAVLEDDIYVSPEMFNYMKGAVDKYADNPKIAGISLYKHEFNINAGHPFVDYTDVGDTYFVQYAMSWGQVWLRKQWREFKNWYDNEEWKKLDIHRIPSNIMRWDRSWLKYHIMFCIDKDLFFVYPRKSLTTNFSDLGEHNTQVSTAMQVPMCYSKCEGWYFTEFEETVAIYDAFFENRKLISYLKMDSLEIDIYGTKQYAGDTKYVLTRRMLPNKVIKSWGMVLRPLEANIFNDISGEDIFLYDLTLTDSKHSKKNQNAKILEYDLKGVDIVKVASIRLCVYRFRYLCGIAVKKFKRKMKLK